MNRYIYAIIDNVANDILGGLIIQRADAAAIRLYGDIASMPESIMGKHPEDYDLVRLGNLDAEHQLVPDYKIIMGGEAWLAAQHPQLVKES